MVQWCRRATAEMLITVAICTLNRAESLRLTLESLAAMRVVADLDWELVVVNNGCTDRTDEVIAGFAGRLPVRREFEPQRGVSNARNRAVTAARGHYIVWTDDDVIVDPAWLAAYVEAFRRWPEAAVFGGPILPHYEAPVVKWVLEAEALLRDPYAVRDFGDTPLALSVAEGRLPYGANFAIRTTEQRRFRYNPELGYGPGRRRLGEETQVIQRILRSGKIGYWVPAAKVGHRIGHDRQTTGYIARYFAGYAETLAFFGHSRGGPLWFGVPRWLWRQLLHSWVRYQFHRRQSPASVWVRSLQQYALILGLVRHSRAQKAREAK